jgi:tetratricopeptide (TPR) repeat protein
VPTGDDPPAEALAHYGAGLSLEWNGHSAESFSNFLRAAELDPDNEELHFRVALSLIQQQRGPEAVALMERLTRRHPRSEQAQLWLALTHQSVGEVDEALAAYERARKIAPRSSLSYVQKAELMIRQKNYDAAMATLEKGLERVAQPLDLYRALGPLYQGHARMELAAGRPAQRLPGAIKLFERALASYPQETELRETLGRLYIMAQAIAEAVATYEPLEEKWANDLRKNQELAISFLLSPNREGTLQALSELSDQQPTNAPLLYYLGTVLEQSKLPGAAEEVYRRAISARPEWPAPYLRRVVLQVAAQEPEEATLTLEDGLLVQPQEVRFLELLAYIQLGRRDYTGALAAFQRAEQALREQNKQPVSPNFYLSQAFALQVTGDYSSAARCLNKAMRINPDFLEAYVHYALRSGQTTNRMGSLKVLDLLAQSTNASASVHAYRGLLHSYAKAYDVAIQSFEKAVQTAHQQEEEEDVLTPTFYFWFASASERNGAFERAVELFKRVLSRKPEAEDVSDFRSYVDALNYLAYMWAERGMEIDQALIYVNEALGYHPDSPAFLDTRGWIYFMQGSVEEARIDIQRALDLMPDDPTITDHMGDLEFKAGRSEEAVNWWKKSFILDPESKSVAKKLSEQGVDLAPLRKKAAELDKTNAPPSEEPEGSLPDFGLDPEGGIPLPDDPE